LGIHSLFYICTVKRTVSMYHFFLNYQTSKGSKSSLRKKKDFYSFWMMLQSVNEYFNNVDNLSFFKYLFDTVRLLIHNAKILLV